MGQSVVVAYVARARGLEGDVVVRGAADGLALVTGVEAVVLVRAGEPDATTRVEVTGNVKDGLVVRLEGVADRTCAEALRGASVAVDLDALPAPTTTAWAWVQIEGFEVVTTGGQRLGVTTDRISTGAHDVLVVLDEDDHEVLVPMSPNVLRAIDGEGRRIVIEAIPGLLDLNE